MQHRGSLPRSSPTTTPLLPWRATARSARRTWRSGQRRSGHQASRSVQHSSFLRPLCSKFSTAAYRAPLCCSAPLCHQSMRLNMMFRHILFRCCAQVAGDRPDVAVATNTSIYGIMSAVGDLLSEPCPPFGAMGIGHQLRVGVVMIKPIPSRKMKNDLINISVMCIDISGTAGPPLWHLAGRAHTGILWPRLLGPRNVDARNHYHRSPPR